MFYEISDFLPGTSGIAVRGIPSLMGLACYVLSSLALYTMARRRKIQHPWLSWVPIANIWILGSLSDQYQYVVKGQVKSKRKLLLTLNIISAILGTVLFFVTFGSILQGIFRVFHGMNEEMAIDMLLGTLFHMAGAALIVVPLVLIRKIFRFMALYDVFVSCDPQNGTMYLVMSIFFPFLEPLFLLIDREKEMGMPPRKTAAARCASQEFRQETPADEGPRQPSGSEAAGTETVVSVPGENESQASENL